MAAKFEIFKATNHQYYFRLKAPNGEIIAVSEGYTTKQNAINGAHAVKRHAPSAPVYDLTSERQGMYR